MEQQPPLSDAKLGALVGGLVGFLLIPLVTIMAIALPSRETMDLVLLLVFAPVAFCVLMPVLGAIGAVLGLMIGSLISSARHAGN